MIRLHNCLFLLLFFLLQGCYKKTIEFGDTSENNFTKFVYIDTVEVKLSTVMIDSFPTNGASSLLLGKYKDPYLGIVSAKPFFQLGLPESTIEIPSTAVFDSLIFIIRNSDYYYGDTSRPQTIYVNELSQPINFSYNDQLYNTSSVAEKTAALGSRTLRISPFNTDSIIIRLDNAKGLELFDKLRQQSTDVTNADNFLNYFRGISLSVAPNDTSAVYGLNGNSTMVMRVIYHHTIPNAENKYIDFPMQTNSYAFNQLIADRAGTVLPSSTTRVLEIPSDQTGNVAFSQSGLGLYLKMTFPSLRDVLKNDGIVKLLKADLVIRPATLSFDRFNYKLPSVLHLAETNGSNTVGNSVVDSSGTATQFSAPYIDDIYGENSHYRFNVTSYVNLLLNSTGSADYGFYLLESWGTSLMHVNRAIINDANRSQYKTQLLLSVLVINN
jgi:hypothetical protein